MTKKKIVRIEPNPFRKVNLKIKMSRAKVNSAGQAMRDTTGNIRTEEVDAPGMIQVPGTMKTLGPALTPSGLKTGLNIMVSNPYKDEEVYHPVWGEKVLKGKEKAMLQNILEYKHGKDFNYYTGNIIDRIAPSHKMAELPFFQTERCKVKLDGHVTFLDLKNPVHEVQYYMLRAHSAVANSYADLQEGRNQTAWYYMVDNAEVNEAKVAKIRKKTRAANALEELYNDAGDVMIKMARALECEDKNLGRDKAYQYVYNYYTRSEQAYARFIKYYDLYKDSARRDQFFAAAELQEYVAANIIRRREDKYYWVKPETDDSPIKTFEWATKEKVIKDFLLAPEYQEEIEVLKSIYEARK